VIQNIKALIINTACDITEVIAINNGDVFSMQENSKNKTSKVLFPLIESVLEQANLNQKDLDYLSCVIGPGSFTGIRIGVSVIRAMAYALNIKCVPVTYFDVLAYKIDGIRDFAIITDAGNGVSYVRFDGKEQVVRTSEAVDYFLSKGITIVTDNKSIEGKNVIYSGGDLLKAFCMSIEKACDYEDLVPVYLRKPQVERKEGDL